MPNGLPQLNTNFVPNAAAAQQNALRTQGMGLRNQLLGQQVANAPRRMEMDEMQLQMQKTALDIRKKALEQADSPGPISIDYPDFTVKGPADSIARVSAAVAQFPDQVNDPNFPAWVAQQGVSYEIKEQKAGKYSAPKEGLDEQGNPVMYRVGPDGKPQIIQGIKPKPGKGMKIYDPTTGNLLVDTGGDGPEMSKKTQGAIEAKITGGKEQLARMQTIYNEYKPEYQEIGTRLSAAWTGLKSKLGQGVSTDEKQTLTDFKKFQRKAIENINLYIKELTGAQMSEKEADRLRLAQPDPGEKWYSGDDPITFKAKMDDVLKYTRASVARYQYYRAKGLGDSQIKAIINDDSAVSLDALVNKME